MTAAAFRAAYSDFKLVKTRSVVQIIFEVPLEQADLAYQVIGGMPTPGAERWCAIARLDDTAKEVMPLEPPIRAIVAAADQSSAQPDRPHKPRKPVAADKRLAQQAGICCADPVFQQFLYERCCIAVKCEEETAKFVRDHCHVTSRSWIVPGHFAAKQWEDLHGQFIAWKLVDAA